MGSVVAGTSGTKPADESATNSDDVDGTSGTKPASDAKLAAVSATNSDDVDGTSGTKPADESATKFDVAAGALATKPCVGCSVPL